MQKVAAYLLERRDGMERAEQRATEAESIKQKILEWLRGKGAVGDGSRGTYAAEDQSNAKFTIEEAQDPPRTWWMTRLEEITPDGRCFVASVSVTTAVDKIAVYTSLEAGSDATQVSPVEIDPRTPRIIRTLLAMPGHWYHGVSRIQQIQRISGFESGEVLADEILNPLRTVPIILLTKDHEDFALPNLDRALSRNVAGLANVVALDQDGTWAITDRLGTTYRCFGGAVRIYWPRFDFTDGPARHPLWTAARLRASDRDTAQTLERFCHQIRTIIMRASALSVVRPREIDEIRGAAIRQAFAEMKSRASSLEDFQTLADAYATENDKLRAEKDRLQDECSALSMRVADLDAKYSTLRIQAERAAKQLLYHETGEAKGEVEIEPEDDTSDEEAPPRSDEIRYYKKKFAASAHDVMVRVGDCGCNRWENANKADKARKGIIKIEGGRSDWKTLQHCASCDGGGMWKVRW